MTDCGRMTSKRWSRSRPGGPRHPALGLGRSRGARPSRAPPHRAEPCARPLYLERVAGPPRCAAVIEGAGGDACHAHRASLRRLGELLEPARRRTAPAESAKAAAGGRAHLENLEMAEGVAALVALGRLVPERVLAAWPSPPRGGSPAGLLLDLAFAHHLADKQKGCQEALRGVRLEPSSSSTGRSTRGDAGASSSPRASAGRGSHRQAAGHTSTADAAVRAQRPPGRYGKATSDRPHLGAQPGDRVAAGLRHGHPRAVAVEGGKVARRMSFSPRSGQHGWPPARRRSARHCNGRRSSGCRSGAPAEARFVHFGRALSARRRAWSMSPLCLRCGGRRVSGTSRGQGAQCSKISP